LVNNIGEDMDKRKVARFYGPLCIITKPIANIKIAKKCCELLTSACCQMSSRFRTSGRGFCVCLCTDCISRGCATCRVMPATASPSLRTQHNRPTLHYSPTNANL